MLLTQKLLSFIHRVFKKDPDQFLALRLGYNGGMTWSVAEGVLTTSVSGGIGHGLTIDLSQYTITSLVNYLAAQPGYQVLYIDGTEQAQLSARVLLDGSNDISLSNGDHLYGYTNVLWAFLEAASVVLGDAKAAIAQMLLQMSTTTAGDVWLDELGGYYGIPRLAAETDASYGPRIIAEVLRPRANNVAMEAAIKVFTGQAATVTDVVEWAATFPTYDSEIHYDGSHNYASSTNYPRYGLFDVQYGYDLINGGSFAAFQQTVTDLINRLRDAGTHLRSLSLVGGTISDTYTTPPTDGDAIPFVVGAPLTDAATAPTETTSAMPTQMGLLADTLAAPGDAAGLNTAYSTTYNGQRAYDGSVLYASGSTVAETI